MLISCCSAACIALVAILCGIVDARGSLIAPGLPLQIDSNLVTHAENGRQIRKHPSGWMRSAFISRNHESFTPRHKKSDALLLRA